MSNAFVRVQDATNLSRGMVVNADGSINIAGSITASLAGFTPNGNVATLAVTSSSGNVALPAGTVVAVTNSGATDCSIKLSVGAGTAATTDWILKSGACVGLTVGSNTFINAITASSTTTLSMEGGVGLVTGFGGGGSGGGGGGAVTIADGADVTLGAKADAKSTATDTTAITAMQVLKQISFSSQATAVAQGSTTSGQNGTLIQGAVLTSAPTYTTAQTSPVTMDTAGAIRVNVTSATGVAQGSTSSGQTLSPIGVRTLSTSPTDTTAQTNMPVADIKGSLAVQPYGLADNSVSGLTSAMTGTTSTAVTGIGAAAGLHNYITQVTIGNSHATVGTFVSLQDGSGGTSFYTFPAAAVYGGCTVTFPKPLRQPTANTALYCVNATTGANVILSASGFQAP